MRAEGMALPDLEIAEAVTLDRVIVASQPLSHPTLVHELIHVVQYSLLGADRFAQRYLQEYLTFGYELHAIGTDGSRSDAPICERRGLRRDGGDQEAAIVRRETCIRIQVHDDRLPRTRGDRRSATIRSHGPYLLSPK